MSPVLILSSLLVPLLFPLLALAPGHERTMRYGLPLLPLPALALVLLSGPGWTLELPYLLNGGVWVMDELRWTFLLLTASLWTGAGLFATGYLDRTHLIRFATFWGLTLTGNLGLILAGDIASFYSFFALMTFAAYGLVIHEGSREARRAGRIYLVMAILGEMALLAGLLLAAAAAGSDRLDDLPAAIANAPNRDTIIALLITGFGVKAGLPLLHFWLPLAHPVAPTPASAVLSGAMIKAGLLGWLVTLPLSETALPGWGMVLVTAGALASIGGALIGLCQQQAKAILAYSSISQMGLITLMLGTALAEPARAGAIIPVIGLYALHHGLAKGSLFLSAGLSNPVERPKRWFMWTLIALPGLSLAGLPFTSGAVAKLTMKQVLAPGDPGAAYAAFLAPVMSAGAIATLLLILRYLRVLGTFMGTAPNPAGVTAGWLLATLTSLAGFWLVPWSPQHMPALPAWVPSLQELWKLTWPMLTALVIAGAAWRWPPRVPPLPPGDAVVLFERFSGALRNPSATASRRRPGASAVRPTAGIHRMTDCMEERLRNGAGLTMLLLIVVLSLL